MRNNLAILNKDQQYEISKQDSLAAYNTLLATITRFSKYVGPDGKGATSPAGLSIQINIKIKQMFVKPVDQIKDSYEIKILDAIRVKLDRVINNGEANNLNRCEIKKNVYAAIEAVYKAMI